MYRHILIPLDDSHASEGILPWVQSLIQRPEGKVRLLTVYRPMQAVVVGKLTIAYGHQLETQAHMIALAHLRRVATCLRADGMSVVCEVRCGDPTLAIVEVARTSGVDLIAMATREASGRSRLIGRSITAEVLRKAPVPVLVTRCFGQRAT